MKWIADCEGNLLNLDKISRIIIQEYQICIEEERVSYVKFKIVAISNNFEYTLFRSEDEEECRAKMDFFISMLT